MKIYSKSEGKEWHRVNVNPCKDNLQIKKNSPATPNLTPAILLF